MLFSETLGSTPDRICCRVLRRGLSLFPLVLLFLIPALCSCHRETDTDRLLADIEERFNDTMPDVRLLLRQLDSIPSASLDNDRRRELHGLLRSKGNIYCGDYPETDSALTAHVEFFRKEGDDRHLFEALIVRSSWNLFKRNLSDAMSDAFEAKDIAVTGIDTLHMARVEKMLMYAFEPVYQDDSVLSHAQKCCSYYAACGRYGDVRRHKRFVAVYLNGVGRTDEALALMDSVVLATPITDSVSLAEIYNSYIMIYVAGDSLAQAEKSFRNSLKYSGNDFLKKIDWRNVLMMFYAAGKIDSVEHYLPVMKDHYYGGDGNFYYYRYSQLAAEARGDYKRAYKYARLADSISQFRHNVTVTQAPSLVTSEYYNKEAQKEAVKVETRNNVIFIVVLSSLIAIIFLMLFFRFRLKQRKEREISTLMELDSVREQLESAKIDRSVAEVLFKAGFESLDKLITEYFIAKSTGRGTPESVIRSMDLQLEKLRSKGSLDLISDKIELLYNGILSKIKLEMPKIKTADIYFIALKLAGFSPKSICLLLEISPTNYYTKWQRIRARIAESNVLTTNADLFS